MKPPGFSPKIRLLFIDFFRIQFQIRIQIRIRIWIRIRIRNVYFGSGSDPDPAKSFWSFRIRFRIRIRNTACRLANPPAAFAAPIMAGEDQQQNAEANVAMSPLLEFLLTRQPPGFNRRKPGSPRQDPLFQMAKNTFTS